MITFHLILCSCFFFFFFKQKTAYEMRISDWSSDVCSSDLLAEPVLRLARGDADPALGDRIFLDVGALGALEADADAALQHFHVEMRRARIGRHAVGRCIGHLTVSQKMMARP